MSKIGIIVDGQGEYHSFNERFKNLNIKILKTDGPRGHLAKLEDIIVHSKKQVNILKNFKCTKAIILIDMEERQIDINSFMHSAENYINNTEFPIETHIAIANKMIENWYLADIAYLSTKKKYLKKQKRQKNYEGQHGKNILKSLFSRGYDYHEITHGKELFTMLRFNEAKEYSKSLEDFLYKLENSDC